MSAPRKDSRPVLIYAAAIVIGTGVGFKAMSWIAAPKALEPGSFGAAPLPAPDSRGVPRVRPPAAPKAGESEFDELMALIGQAESEPAARAFAEEFKKEPALGELWEEFEREGHADEDHPVEGFARALTERAEFRKLVAKFAQEPGFRQVALTFSESPTLKKVVKATIARVDAKRRARLGGLGRARGAGAVRTPGRVAASGVQAHGAGAPGASSGGTGATGAGRGGAATALPGVPAPGESSEAGSDGTTPLADVPSSNGSSPLNAWASLCYRDDPRMPRRMCDALKDLLGDYDVWEACLVGKVWDDCVKACRDVPELGCSGPPGWLATCLEAYDAAKCRELCRRQGRGACDADDPAKRAILGYRRKDDGTLEPDPREREIILQVFELFRKHRDIAVVVRKLEARYDSAADFHDKRGDALDDNSVGALLKRRQYAGADGFPRILPKGLFEEVERQYRSHGFYNQR